MKIHFLETKKPVKAYIEKTFNTLIHMELIIIMKHWILIKIKVSNLMIKIKPIIYKCIKIILNLIIIKDFLQLKLFQILQLYIQCI